MNLRRIDRRLLWVVLAVVVLTAANTIYLKFKHSRPDRGEHPAEQRVAPVVGFVDELLEDTPEPGQITVVGWAVSKAGIASVELVVNGQQRFALAIGIPRPDVAAIHPDYPDSKTAGFRGTVNLSETFGADQIRILEIIVTDKRGATTSLKQVVRIPANANSAANDVRRSHNARRDDVFYFIMATSNIAGGGAADIDTVFRPFESETVKVGVRVPILYLRTTSGKAGDYSFDPDFPISRKCGDRQIAGDNLSEVIAHAIAHRLPVLFTLNGGIWADAACDAPQWDVNDFLEQDKANCQWNEHGQVMPDDHLKNLTGSYTSPELGRALTFNVYAESNRRYKKRNLQQAGRLIKEFATRHPDLFIGVTLDPDVYINPFFDGSQWYDYNPGTLRQFREWLQGSGPYAGRSGGTVPDLSAYRRKQPLALADVNALSGRSFTRWDEVDPPRNFDDKGKVPFWEDAWVAEWEHFRRHLVDLHYDELSEWLSETGIGAEFVYSAQGFMPPGKYIQPFPIAINSPAKNYDAGGMSIEGSIPSRGHLGAILYGASAINKVRMESRDTLFSVFRKLDPGWAVVEFNTADLTNPERLPDFAVGYRSLRDIYNYGARFVSPMAWNGSRGGSAGQPGFSSHTALRDTPLEDAIKQFMITHANVPGSSRLWTFGTPQHADDDGWQTPKGTRGSIGPGRFTLRAMAGASGMGIQGVSGPGPISFSCQSRCVGSLESPGDLAFRPVDYRAIVVKVDAVRDLETLGVDGQMSDGKWVPIVPAIPVADLQSNDAGMYLRLPESSGELEFQRIRLNWKTAASATIGLRRIALLSR